MTSKSFSLAVFAALCASAPASAQSLLTVHPSGGADFTDLQDALDAASPGDVVQVLQGGFAHVVVSKGVTLLGGPGTLLQKPMDGPGANEPAVRVTGLPAGQTFVLSGFTVFVGNGGAEAAIVVHDNEGAVWIQDAFIDSYGAQALLVRDSASVTVIDSLLQTNLVPALPDGTPPAAPGATFVGLTRGFGYDVQMVGSHGTLQGGSNPTPNGPHDGGPGLIVEDALLHLTGGSVGGGSGNSFFTGSCTVSGDGGDGLQTLDGPAPGLPSVVLRDTPVNGAGPGFHDASCAPTPTSGVAFDIVPGTSVTSAAPARHFALAISAEAGASVTLSFDGEPGDLALLLVSNAPSNGFAVGQLDLHLAPAALTLLAVLPMGAGGALELSVPLPALPVGLDVVPLPLQAIFVDTGAGKHAAAPRMLVVR